MATHAHAIALAVLALLSTDWPALWGPARNGRVDGPALPRGALQLREAWRRPIGSGFSEIAIVGARAFTGASDGTNDHLIAFDPATGREHWRSLIGPTYRGHDGSRDGPISTPTVDDGRVLIVGPHGALLAFDAASGRELWRHDLKKEYGAKEPVYGFGTSPLVAGRLAIVQVGGEQHNLSAFDKTTGALAWSVAHSKTTGYGSPVLATLDGTSQVVVQANDLAYAVRPEDGTLLWSHPTGWQDESARPPMPAGPNGILVGSWNESRLLDVRREGGRWTVATRWTTPRLKNSYSPTVYHDGHLYGFNAGFLVCMNPANGEVVWRHRTFPGSLILVDAHLVILGNQSGELRIAEASPAGYRERASLPVFNAGATSHTGPSLANGRLYLRNVEEMVAVEITG